MGAADISVVVTLQQYSEAELFYNCWAVCRLTASKTTALLRQRRDERRETCVKRLMHAQRETADAKVVISILEGLFFSLEQRDIEKSFSLTHSTGRDKSRFCAKTPTRKNRCLCRTGCILDCFGFLKL